MLDKLTVVDSNVMQSSKLRDYLSVAHHVAVLPDFVWIECYKQQSVRAVSELFSTLRYFPDQVIVLHDGRAIAGLDPRRHGYRDAFERRNVGADIRAMTKAIDEAEAGAEGVLAQLRARWADTSSLMTGMTEGTEILAPTLNEVAEIFTADEIYRCRTRSPYTGEMTEKVFRSAFALYETFVEQDGRVPVLPPYYAIQTYYYRLALGTMLHCLWWIRNGSQPVKRPARLRNDFIDLGLAIYATYYDDLLTDDAKAAWMYRELSNALAFAASIAVRP